MEPQHPLTPDCLQLVPSPGDGHCLLHSLVTSYKHQLQTDIDIHHIKSKIFVEATINASYYCQFLTDNDTINFSSSLRLYIINKIYNNSFADLLPLITANSLLINIIIYNQKEGNAWERFYIQCSNTEPVGTLTLHRKGDHYNGVAQAGHISSSHSSSCIPLRITGTAPSVICRQLSRPAVKHWGLTPTRSRTTHNLEEWHSPNCNADNQVGPGPGVYYRQLSRPVVAQLDLVSHSLADNISGLSSTANTSTSIACPKRITYNSDELHRLRPSNPRISRDVRKTIFSCNIWKPRYNHSNSRTGRPFDKNMGAHQHLLRRLSETNLHSAEPRDDKQPDKLKFLLMNAQSVKNKDFAIRQLIDECKADISIITETWLTEEDDVWLLASELNNNGLSMKPVNRQGQRGGGIAIVHTSNIKVNGSNNGARQSFEYAVWKLKYNHTTTSIIAIYRPPYSERNKSSIASFCEDFSDFLSEVMAEETHVIVAGDFNIHINNTEDSNARLFLERMDSLGLHQHVSGPTQKSGNTLDLIFTEADSHFNIERCEGIHYISDHCAILCELGIIKEPLSKQQISYRNYKGINLVELQKDISAEHPDTDNVDDLVAWFEEKAKSVIDKHAPERTKTVTVRNKKPWFSAEVRQQRRKVRRRERVWRRTKSPLDWKSFCKDKTDYANLLRYTKIQAISSKVRDCQGNSKQLYQLFNSTTGQKADNTMPESSSDQELANAFADHFMHKINTIRSALDNTPRYKPDRTPSGSLDSFTQLSSDEVKKIIASLSTKSCELDCIPTSILKSILPGVLPVITKITNLSLTQGTFVSTWKTAIVRPLLKKPGLEPTLANYRPVSNLCFLSKVLEKAVLNQFMDHCNEHSLFPDYQSAYRRHHSCETALVKLFNDILWNMEDKEVTALLAIDLSVAFDTVDHEVLLDVLEAKFGVNGNALLWFDNYLRPRNCKINIGSSYSSARELNFSVPQGSCAGPVLFSVYASTIQNVVTQDISLHGYADDHALKISFNASEPNAEELTIRNLAECTDNIKKWMDYNRLKMNTSKTEFIMFGSRQQLQKCTSKDFIFLN